MFPNSALMKPSETHYLEEGRLIELPLPRQEIAEAIVISRVTVILVLGQLEQEKKDLSS